MSIVTTRNRIFSFKTVDSAAYFAAAWNRCEERGGRPLAITMWPGVNKVTGGSFS